MRVHALLVWRDGRTALATVAEPPPVFLSLGAGGVQDPADPLDRGSSPCAEFARGAGHSRLPIYEELQAGGRP